jgi:hypothetical protein
MKRLEIIRLIQELVVELSSTGTGASFTAGQGEQYATPFAFSKKGTKNRATKFQEKMGMTVVKPRKRPYNTKLIDYLDENINRKV